MNGGRLTEGYTQSDGCYSAILAILGFCSAGGLMSPTFGCDGWGTQREGNRAGDSSKQKNKVEQEIALIKKTKWSINVVASSWCALG